MGYSNVLVMAHTVLMRCRPFVGQTMVRDRIVTSFRCMLGPLPRQTRMVAGAVTLQVRQIWINQWEALSGS